MFVVVEFKKGKIIEFEVVPFKWIKNNKCLWPSDENSNVVEYIKHLVMPKPAWNIKILK